MTWTATKLAVVLLLVAGAARAGEGPGPDLKTLKAENTRLRTLVERLTKENRRAKLDREKANTNLRMALEQNKLLLRQAAVTRRELQQTRRVTVALKEREAVLRANTVELTNERDHLKIDYRRVAADMLAAQNVLDQLVKKGVKLPPVHRKVPDIRSQIRTLDPKTGEVTLEGGANLEVKRGFFFNLYRRGPGGHEERLVGRVRITGVAEHSCTGKVIERLEAIKARDGARTDTKAPYPKATVEFEFKSLPRPIPRKPDPPWGRRVALLKETDARHLKEIAALLRKSKIGEDKSGPVVKSLRVHQILTARQMKDAYDMFERVRRDSVRLTEACIAMKKMCTRLEGENRQLRKGKAAAPEKGKAKDKPGEAF